MAQNLVSELASDAPAPAADPLAGVPPQAQLVLRGIANGQLPGALVDENAPKIESGLDADTLQQLGIGLYIPKTPGLLAVAFSPKQVSEKMLQGMDKDGSLAENFPKMSDLLESSGGSSGAPTGETMSDGGAAAPTTPVLPRPTFGGSAAASTATRRVNALTQEPSKRTIPGGGSVLNGLIDRPA